METFRGCRRAWDLGARVRQAWVPRTPASVFDLEKAVRVGLAVYYLPAMDDWNRFIVRPLAVKGFQRAMAEHRATYAAAQALTPAQEVEFQRYLQLGEVLLTHYFDYADGADDFDSMLADEDIWSPIADPSRPGEELGTPDGRPIRFMGRIDALISDPADEFWILDHRVAWNGWASDDDLLGDLASLRAMWSVEQAYPQIKISGTIHNELAVGEDDLARLEQGRDLTVPQGSAPRDLRDMTGVRHVSLRRTPLTPDEPRIDADDIVGRGGTAHARRTTLRRAREWIDDVGLLMARDAVAMRDPAAATAPTFSAERCPTCLFKAPCDALEAGEDPATILAERYRLRTEAEFEEDGLRRSSARRQDRAMLGGGLRARAH